MKGFADMYELKTKVNNASVLDFIMHVDQAKRREDSLKLLDVFCEATGEDATMWGDSIIGYGTYHYKYASGQEGDWMRTGFAPRKKALSLYLMFGLLDNAALLSQLGKFKTGKGCLYINKLEDVDMDILKKLIRNSYERAGE